MALLGKLLQSGLEEAGEDIAKKAFSKGVKKTAKKVEESTLAKIGKKIPVSMTSDFPSDFARVPVKVGGNADDMVTLYRGLTQKYDPNFPVSKLDTSGYESFTDNLDLARQYGDNVVSINVPKRDIKTSYLDENPMSLTYGDRNPIYSIDKPAGLNGVSGNEYLLEVGSDYQKALKYNEVANDLDNASKFLGEPMHLYHQTSASSLGDMAIDKRKAIGADYGMPEGIFLKETPEDIGLPGKNQLALDATMENPITFEDRQALAKYVGDRSPAYKSIMDELDKINNDYEEYVFDYMADRGMNPDDFVDFDTAMNEVDKYVEEKAKDAREMVRNQLTNEGYDSAIVNVDEGTKGRKVKSYIVFDKNQLKPRYSNKIKFNPEDATSVYSYAKGKQADMKSMLDGVAKELDLSGKKYSVVADKNKSIDSMVKKVNRKQASGRDYRLMDMKDHVRGAFMVDDLTDKDAIGEVMDAIQREVGAPVSVENVKSEMGYNGIHLTWRDEDGLGYEVQITNPEVWKTKKASDRIYHKWRNVTPAELDADPKKMMQYLNDERESKNLWGDLWRKLGFNNNAPDFSWAENWLEDMGDMGF